MDHNPETAPSQPRVLIVEDQRLPASLFEQFISGSGRYHLAASVQSADAAYFYCATGQADLVLMDVLIPGSISGLEAARAIKALRPETKIIIVTSMPELSFLRQAREIGVDSFWYKEVQEQPLLEIMDRTMAGESVYPSASPVVTMGNASSADFTEREAEVLRELVTGASNREIGETLSIAENTVKMHITNMLQKTGYHSRLELAVKARHLGVAIKE